MKITTDTDEYEELEVAARWLINTIGNVRARPDVTRHEVLDTAVDRLLAEIAAYRAAREREQP